MMDKKRAARIGGILLSAAMLFSQTACGLVIVNDLSGKEDSAGEAERESTAEKQPGETEKEYEKYEEAEDGRALSARYLEALPERDYEGAVFFITTPSRAYLAPEEVLTSVDQLALERNAEVEERLNIEILTAEAPAETMLRELKQAIQADTYYTDLLLMPVYMIGQFRKDETLLNLRTLPFFDLEQPYFNRESSDMTSGGYTTYGVAGEASISPDSFSAVYMNTELLTRAGVDVEELYRQAGDGSWTWDLLLTCTEAVRNLNESGTEERSYYTVTAQNTASRLPDLLFKAMGNDFIRTARRKSPVLGYSYRSAARTMDTLAAVYNDPFAITDGTAGAIGCFRNGEAAFLIEYLSEMPRLADASAAWGLLPLPKEQKKDEYRTLIANTELIFGVPVNHTNGEIAAVTLSALNAASVGYIYDDYVQYNMLHVLRDNESVNMLDMLLDTASFDFALAFGNAYPYIADATYKLIRSKAASNDLKDGFAERMVDVNSRLGEDFNLKY